MGRHRQTIVVAILLKIVGDLLMGAQMSYNGFCLGPNLAGGAAAVCEPGRIRLADRSEWGRLDWGNASGQAGNLHA